MLPLEHHGITDPGKVRRNNEDSLLVGEGQDEMLFVVADGIGGLEAGEVASSMAVDVLKETPSSEPLEGAIREANRRILVTARGDNRLSGMGTTVVAMRFGDTDGEPVVEISYVGDSRAYLLRDGGLRPLTEDHSLVAELVRSGDLTRAQASEHPQKNLITRALGAEEDVEVDTIVLPVEPGDRLMLCSDGLSDMVPEKRMQEILAASPKDLEGATHALVSAALDAGGVDNVTVVVVDVKEREKPPTTKPVRGDTREMRAVLGPGRAGKEAAERRKRPQRQRKKRSGGGSGVSLRRSLLMFVRALTVVLVLAAFTTPFYLWAQSRYFLAFSEGEVVIYRGLPYAPLGYELNKEERRTGLQESDIQQRYRSQISEHKLYTKEGADQVVSDLGRS
jgi:protein phosphatase